MAPKEKVIRTALWRSSQAKGPIIVRSSGKRKHRRIKSTNEDLAHLSKNISGQ